MNADETNVKMLFDCVLAIDCAAVLGAFALAAVSDTTAGFSIHLFFLRRRGTFV